MGAKQRAIPSGPQSAETLRLILGDQLNAAHSWFARVDTSVLHVMIEARSETDYVRHHIQKVACIFAAMRRFAGQLRAAGHRVEYFRLDDRNLPSSLAEALPLLAARYNCSRIEYQLPDEYRLDRALRDACNSSEFEVQTVDSEHFLTKRGELGEFFGPPEKARLMEYFYRHMRRKHDILMDGDKPEGGAWNFDADNRRKFRGEVALPPLPAFDNNVEDICALLEREGVQTIGTIDPQRVDWPLDRDQALIVLEHFCELLLPHFGRFQDAMSTASPWMFHSRLSFALNVKLLHPREVIDASIRAWREAGGAIDIAQIEGFVRQILGWREYVRGIYWERMPQYASENYFGHAAALPGMYWTGATQMNCMRHSIEQSLELAYAHHIQRLMITGNFALLIGVHPDEVDAWYLGIYIDAFEWVELPNTRGMSQFADGGVLGSKPYVASANYINKMSDYCGGCRYDRTQKTGESSCPFNSLYWEFLVRHRELLGRNRRLGMTYRVWDRMDAELRRVVLQRAAWLREHVEDL